MCFTCITVQCVPSQYASEFTDGLFNPHVNKLLNYATSDDKSCNFIFTTNSTTSKIILKIDNILAVKSSAVAAQVLEQ